MAKKIAAWIAKDGSVCKTLPEAKQADAWHEAMGLLEEHLPQVVHREDILNTISARGNREVIRELLRTSEALEKASHQ